MSDQHVPEETGDESIPTDVLDVEAQIELEVGDPCVPTELLDLYVQLEDLGVTPDEFKEVVENAIDLPL